MRGQVDRHLMDHSVVLDRETQNLGEDAQGKVEGELLDEIRATLGRELSDDLLRHLSDELRKIALERPGCESRRHDVSVA